MMWMEVGWTSRVDHYTSFWHMLAGIALEAVSQTSDWGMNPIGTLWGRGCYGPVVFWYFIADKPVDWNV